MVFVYFIQVENKKRIMQTIILNEALNKRRIYLDAILYGLDALGVKSLLIEFPDKMKQVFVSPPELKPPDVLNMLAPLPSRMTDAEQDVWKFLLDFVTSCTSDGMSLISHATMHYNTIIFCE